MKLEFYDYSTPAGRAETQSQPNNPRVKPLLNKLLGQYSSQQMQAPLPASLRPTVARARTSALVFNALVDAYSYKQLVQGQKLKTVTGFGGNF